MPAIKNILVATDLADTSERVHQYAIELANKLGAKITLLHVFSLPIYNFPDGTFVPTAEVAAQVSDAARRHLDATTARLKEQGIDVAAVLRSGAPADEIQSVAKEIGADLIIMGTHGRGALGRALLGSTANAIIRTSNTPVITIRTNQ